MSSFLYNNDTKVTGVVNSYANMMKEQAVREESANTVAQIRIALRENADTIIKQLEDKLLPAVGDASAGQPVTMPPKADLKDGAAPVAAVSVTTEVKDDKIRNLVRGLMDNLLYSVTSDSTGASLQDPTAYAAAAKALFNDERLTDLCKLICVIYADAKAKAN